MIPFPFPDDGALGRAIADRRDDLVALTRDLIRIPTRNPPGENYREICDYLDTRLRQAGFATELIRADGSPGDCEPYPRWNIVARREGRRPGACVHFNSHIDVVEEGHGWTTDPFGGEVIDGRIYGRGACDMKGGLAASIIAVEAFLQVHPDFDGAIEISGTADEESGGYGGVAYLAERGYFAPRPRAARHHPRTVEQGSGLSWSPRRLVGRDRDLRRDRPRVDAVPGRLRGAPHGRGSRQVRARPVSRHGRAPYGYAGGARRRAVLDHEHQLDPRRAGRAATDSTALPSHCVPDSCRIVIDRRYLVEESHDSVKGEIEALLNQVAAERPTFRYALREMNHVIPSMTDRDAPVASEVARQIAAVLGRQAEFVASPGTYDQKHIDRIGKLHDCVAYGPGILDLAHKPDEYVGVDDMIDSAEVMARSLAELLHTKQNDP